MSQSGSTSSPASIGTELSTANRQRDAHNINSYHRLGLVERPGTVREEALVVDERSGVRPAQVVERKLSRVLKEASLPVSHLQMSDILRRR